MKKELFPSIKSEKVTPTLEEIEQVATEMVKIWMDPPEVLVGYAVDGEFRDAKGAPYTENSEGAVAVMTNEAHLSRRWITRAALDATDIEEDRKVELGRVKSLLHRAEELLFEDGERIKMEVLGLLLEKDSPTTKTAMDAAIEEKHLPVAVYTRRYMDHRTRKENVAFSTFKSTVVPAEKVVEPAPVVE